MKKILLSLLVVMSAASMSAQTIDISGTVFDENRKPMNGCYIHTSESRYTMSDSLGHYSIPVSYGDEVDVIFEYQGYEKLITKYSPERESPMPHDIIMRLSKDTSTQNDSPIGPIVPNTILVYGASLYTNEGDKLTDEQIMSLSSYGFDYERYCQLKKGRTMSVISYLSGGALIGIGGFIGRRPGENTIEALSLSSAGSILAILGIYKKTQYDKRIRKLVGEMAYSPQVSFSASGVGLTLFF